MELKIMPLGDSITDGYNIPGGYRTKLWDSLTDRNLEVNFVGSQTNGPRSLGDRNHEGHSGWRIDQLANSVDRWLRTQQPAVILLMIGTNDIIQNYGVGSAPRRLSALIDRITDLAPNASLLVASIPPLSNSASNQKVRTFNAALPDIVAAQASQGKKVKFVDMYSQLRAADLADGVHPNQTGYNKIAQVWDRAISQLNLSSTTTSGQTLSGTSRNDRLTGTSGAEVFVGGPGRDTLTGAQGSDVFKYNSRRDGRDTITDFGGNDQFHISAKGFGGGLTAGVSLSQTVSATGTLVQGANPVAVGSSANFLFNTSNRLLSFDPDGAGGRGPTAIATLNGVSSLNPTQFKIG